MPASEPKNIPLNGLFSLPPGLALTSVQHRAKFWKLIGKAAFSLKRGEIESGIDIWGNKFQPVKRSWGDSTPLLPHGKGSRTYRLLSLNSTARGATLFWKHGGGRESWSKILGYHAYQHGPRNLPVRNEIGLSPRSVEAVMARSAEWQAGYEAGKEASQAAPVSRAETRLEKILRRKREEELLPPAVALKEDVKARIRYLHAQGKSAAQIAKELGVSTSSVYKYRGEAAQAAEPAKKVQRKPRVVSEKILEERARLAKAREERKAAKEAEMAAKAEERARAKEERDRLAEEKRRGIEERKAAREQARLEKEQKAIEEAARRTAARKAGEKIAETPAEKRAKAASARKARAEEKKAAEEAARKKAELEAEKRKAEVKTKKEKAPKEKKKRETQTERIAREQKERVAAFRQKILSGISAGEEAARKIQSEGTATRETFAEYNKARLALIDLQSHADRVGRTAAGSDEHAELLRRRDIFQSDLAKAASALMERISQKVPGTAAWHGMSTPSKFSSFTFEGLDFHYEPGLESQVSQTLGLLAVEAKLPDRLTKHTKRVVFTAQANSADDYWKKAYNDPTHVSAATGGDGSITIYNGMATYPQTIAHESGHNLATAIYGNTKPRASSDFAAAARSGEKPVTPYAENSLDEDFAESVRYYVTVPADYFKARAPRRYEVIKRIFEEAGYGG